MSKLLISVRSATEAQAALAGGAALIDVKDPARGSLGRADDAVIAAVLRAVGNQRPVSAALGELRESAPVPATPGLAYLKWGLSGLVADADWPDRLVATAAQSSSSKPVAVAYADWQRAQSPPPTAVADFAVSHRWPVLLLDTFVKDGRSLLDWMPLPDLGAIAKACHRAGVEVALAGSIRLAHLPELRRLEPDWIAVRGAVCKGGARTEEVCADRVRELAAQLS